MKQKKYRDNGAAGALLDEYERAISDLKDVLSTVTEEELIAVADAQTTDVDCRSIQSVLTHIVRAGYCYVVYVRNNEGETLGFPEKKILSNISAYNTALDQMFAYNVQLFDDYPHLTIEESDNARKMLVAWGQLYDVEQIFEHAIVHILRHRRQIERFLLKLRGES